MTKTFKEIQEARSSTKGIIFYSNQKNSPFGVETFIDEGGKIRAKIYLSSNYSLLRNMDSNWFYESEDMPHVKYVYVIILKLLLIVVAALSGSFNVGFAIVYFEFMVLNDIIAIFCEWKYIKYNNEGKKLGRFHAAEHKAINAYTKYKRIPTCDEIKAESKISPECGSRFTIRKIAAITAISIIMAVVSKKSLFLYLVSVAILIILILLDKKFNYLRIFQYIFVNEPTDTEIKVARQGLIMYEKINNDIEGMKVIFDDSCISLMFKSVLFNSAVIIETDCNDEE